ncbi:hypothetical protein IscW_ISCW011711 [Ixodes scapularis]|uniref:Uncharacterized protein n=1 Tax=Ixodes scapularis TaxID=6945 RepID=B7Q950_IXOSC|nr:hypothetical protein IscW_ISCW011711 [Ixodes scapularis]|eukprot:XP_002412457.1 hypothetical protein IscW_ISCW011711 [Ixodes scapularis]
MAWPEAIPAGDLLAACNTILPVCFVEALQTGSRRKYRRLGDVLIGTFGLSSKPPEYVLSHVEVPVAIYWSKGDWFAVEEDVARLRDRLSNVVAYYQVPDEQFTHYDFSWGISAEPILFRQMMSVMAKYQT